MISHQAKDELSRLIVETSGGLDSLRASDVIKLMTDFYRDQRASDCEISEDGDMLLFEWGVYRWGGESFRVGVTRQFIPRGGNDDAIYQLILEAHYEPDDEVGAAQIAAKVSRTSNKWCGSPEDLNGFLDFIAVSPAMTLAAERNPFKVTLDYNLAG